MYIYIYIYILINVSNYSFGDNFNELRIIKSSPFIIHEIWSHSKQFQIVYYLPSFGLKSLASFNKDMGTTEVDAPTVKITSVE